LDFWLFKNSRPGEDAIHLIIFRKKFQKLSCKIFVN
jgi:hypothetical protein